MPACAATHAYGTVLDMTQPGTPENTATTYDIHHNRIASHDSLTAGQVVALCQASERGRVAYVRCSVRGHLVEIYFTQRGRDAGIRNYQARQQGDARCHITGAAPVHTAPRIERRGSAPILLALVDGEGNPYSADLSGDARRYLADALQVTKGECGWSGYLLTDYLSGQEFRLVGATLKGAMAELEALASLYA